MGHETSDAGNIKYTCGPYLARVP